MGFSAEDIERKLITKFLFIKSERHEKGHIWYELKLADLPIIDTRVSHGKPEHISDAILSKIAKQLHVHNPFFKQMIQCTKSKEDYYNEVHQNPFPPFPRKRESSI